jgi:hypothetical protein
MLIGHQLHKVKPTDVTQKSKELHDVEVASSYVSKQAIKSVGPAHYTPKITAIAPSKGCPAPWSKSSTKRDTFTNHSEVPGPGNYNQQHMSISVKQIQNMLLSETRKPK